MAFAYHAGERRVQARAGVLEAAARAAAGVHPEVPPVAAAFLAEQTMVLVGHRDGHGKAWASALAGPPGFATAVDPRTITIAARPHPSDALARSLDGGPLALGLLAIEPETKRRMRVNGRAAQSDGTIALTSEQVYSNCPKYINVRRVIDRLAPEPARTSRAARPTQELDARQRESIRAADTFFIATSDGGSGADVSHRGGRPGFVVVHDGSRLSWPDYRGNSMFMTLGNLDLDPSAGLLFPDWESGDVLQLTGHAAVDWDPGRAADFPGAERVVDFTVGSVVALPGALGSRWRLEEYSRVSPNPVPSAPEPQGQAGGRTFR